MSLASNPTESEPAAEAVEAKPKKSMMDRMAFMSKGGEKMDKIPLINKAPRSMRLILVIIIVVVLIVAVSAVVMMMGGDDKSGPSTNKIDPAKLEDWSWDLGAIVQSFLNEGSAESFSIGDMIETNGTVLVDSIEVTITWTDEPDGSVGPRAKTNEPDTFMVEVNSSANVSAMSQEMSNTHGSSQSIILSLDVGTSEFSYLVLGNLSDVKLPDDVVVSDLNVIVYMVEAGDHHSSPELLFLNDLGNDYSIEISLSGKVISE
ncbi:MAG: hypothetical protein LN414_04790 [Candidatus Thermoplasmatota archaeon]|nr:hypothetical protein [Candidatus Thermoplasmatota archaeon]